MKENNLTGKIMEIGDLLTMNEDGEEGHYKNAMLVIFETEDDCRKAFSAKQINLKCYRETED